MGSYLFSEIKGAEKVFSNDQLGDFYQESNKECLLIERSDHVAVSYDFVLPFISKKDKALKLTFDDGKRNQDEYMFKTFVGCMALCHPLQKANDDISQRDLVEIGRADSGEIFYELKDPQHKDHPCVMIQLQ